MRTLFIIALGGTLLALVLAAATSDRITSGLRRLTRVAEDLGDRGSVGARGSATTGSASASAEVAARSALAVPPPREPAGPRDEVGVLAAAFGAMLVAVEDKNTALRHAADDETRLRNRLEAVVAGMGDALVALDGLGRITDFNRAAEELTAKSAAAAIGVVAADVLALSGEGAIGLHRHLERGDAAPWSGLADLIRPDGSVVPVAVSSGAVRGPVGEEIGTVVVLRDLRREQEVERMKTEFLSRVGHELRTPLTGILGYAELLVGHDVPLEAAAAWHAEILAAAKRQLRVVRLLEFFAAWGAGRIVVRPAYLDLAAMLGQVAAGWAARLDPGSTPGPAIRFSCRVEPGLPPVEADREWLVLAIDEVIDNAVKYSPVGGPLSVTARLVTGARTVEAESGPSEAVDVVAGVDLAGNAKVLESGVVEIAVTDRGVGMDRAEMAVAFGTFEQGDPSDTRHYGGLGLGLAAVVQIVADHGGCVRCRSVKGEGTTLRLWLPVAFVARLSPANAGEYPPTRHLPPAG